jgi:hypothetical protein
MQNVLDTVEKKYYLYSAIDFFGVHQNNSCQQH